MDQKNEIPWYDGIVATCPICRENTTIRSNDSCVFGANKEGDWVLLIFACSTPECAGKVCPEEAIGVIGAAEAFRDFFKPAVKNASSTWSQPVTATGAVIPPLISAAIGVMETEYEPSMERDELWEEAIASFCKNGSGCIMAADTFPTAVLEEAYRKLCDIGRHPLTRPATCRDLDRSDPPA